MRVRTAGLVWLISSLGCSDASRILLHDGLPNEVDRVAVVYTAGPNIVASTGLIPNPESAIELELEGDIAAATRVLVTGYDEASIAASMPPDFKELRESPVRFAGAEEVALPQPLWAGSAMIEGDPTTLLPVDPDQTSPLTVDWLRCDDSFQPDADTLIRAGCAERICEGEVRRSGCTLSVDTNLCQLGGLELRLGPRPREVVGARVTDGDRLGTCVGVEAREGASYSVDCGEASTKCEIDVVVPGQDTTPSMQPSVSEPVLDVPYEEIGYYGGIGFVRGYLGGMALLAERIVVTSYDGGKDSALCETSTAGRVFALDRATLEVVGTSSTPACLTQIVPDLSGDGFVGVSGNPVDRIHRFSKDAEHLESRALTLPRGPMVATAALADPRVDLLVFAFSGTEGRDERQNPILIAFDSASLETKYVGTELLGSEVTSLSLATEEGGVVLSDDEDDTVVAYDLVANEVVLGIGLNLAGCSRSGTVITQALGLRPGTALLVDVEAPGTVIRISQELNPPCRAFPYFEKESFATALALWQPGVGDRVLVSGYEVGGSAWVTFLDGDRGAFIPGTARFEGGAVVGLERDGDEVWAMLPWSARVVRLDVR